MLERNRINLKRNGGNINYCIGFNCLVVGINHIYYIVVLKRNNKNSIKKKSSNKKISLFVEWLKVDYIIL